MHRRGLFLFIGFAAFATFIVASFQLMSAPSAGHAEHEGDAGHLPDLPAAWESFRRTAEARGPAAIAEISRLHGKSIIVHDGYRADYAAGSREAFTVWIAATGSPAEARHVQQQMTDKMSAAASQMFSKPEAIRIGGVEVYRSTGMGQTHFYYVRGSAVWWVAITSPSPDALATRVLAGL